MRLSSVLAGLSLLGSVIAHPLDLPFEMTEEHHQYLERALELEERQSSSGYQHVPIKGVSQTTVQPRYEIRQLVHEQPNQFSLFILAMQKFQNMAQTERTGYFQIAGVHGVPQKSWNAIEQCSTCQGTDGYCTHLSILFPGWHRAYMALFEQELYKIANEIADSWPTSGSPISKQAAQLAAKDLRMPYWDWAAIPPSGQHVMPGAISGSTITIQTQTGTQTIANPLFRYSFTQPEESSLVYSPFITWDSTLRWPTSEASNAVSNEGAAVAAFDNIQGSLQDQVYQLMTTCTDYLHFSNTNASGSTSCSNSLEGIHNTVHSTSGGPGTPNSPEGHMTYLSLAAFDPIFWLHHANVDRLFALWQTLHSSYGASQPASVSSWAIPAGFPQNANTPLKPFTKDNAGDFWTLNSVQNWHSTFHYTYPEFLSGGSSQQIASYVNALYGPSATATAGSTKRSAAPEPVGQQLEAATTAISVPTASPPVSTASAAAKTTAEPSATSVASYVSTQSATAPSIAQPTQTPPVSLPNPFTALNGSIFQYVANIEAPHNALNGSYSIYLFNGPPTSENPSDWLFDSNLIGPMAVLTQPGMQSQGIVKGSVPLTRTLQKSVNAGSLLDLTELNVALFLRTALQWRIAGPSATEVDPSTLPGFKLGVYASSSTPLNSPYDLPTWSDFFPLEEITRGRPGGLGSLVNAIGGLIGNLTNGAL